MGLTMSESAKGTPRRLRKSGRGAISVTLAFLLLFATLANAERTKLKPGWNLFSPQQDVELGRKASQEAERQLPLLNDRRVDSYLNNLGRRLADRAPGERYPYQFKAVNDMTINAFALPGGFLYVHRGAIEAADNEAQLAGVMGHEIGHVALRHGTNQATKAYAWQLPLAAFGGIVGSDSLGGVIAQLAAGIGVNSVLLRYSREAERQADLIGTQILYDNNYDPRAMAQFFEKIEAESKGGRAPQWLSDHPNPENRMQSVLKEVNNLGGLPSNYKTDSAEFREIKRYLQSMPPPPKGGSQQRRSRQGQSSKPPRPSDRYQSFRSDSVELRYPDNWRVYERNSTLTIAPDGGIVGGENGQNLLAYGVIVSLFEPRQDRHGRITLEYATDLLIDQLRESNPRMQVRRDHESVRVGGQPALSTLLENDSPVSGRENVWLATVLRAEGLVYFACVVPEGDYNEYRRTFEKLLDSVRFPAS